MVSCNILKKKTARERGIAEGFLSAWSHDSIVTGND